MIINVEEVRVHLVCESVSVSSNFARNFAVAIDLFPFNSSNNMDKERNQILLRVRTVSKMTCEIAHV